MSRRILLWLIMLAIARGEESREAALKEMLEDARLEQEADAALERDKRNDSARAAAAERAEEDDEVSREPPEGRTSLLNETRRRPTLGSRSKEEKEAKKPKNTSKPSNLDELYEIIAEGEKAESEYRRRERNRLYGSPADKERRDRAYRSLSKAERRAVDAEVARILKSMKKSHYAVLGLRRSCRTSTVKQRYRAKALMVHPDANTSPQAPEAFDALRRAHETLADPFRRAEYDRKLVRISKQRSMRLRRELSNLVETAGEYVKARWSQFPIPFSFAGLLAFLLIV